MSRAQLSSAQLREMLVDRACVESLRVDWDWNCNGFQGPMP